MSKFETINFVDRLKLEEAFFNKEYTLSSSGLSKLLYSPELFYRHYVLNQRDDSRTQSMIEGSLLHCLLLTPERFDKEYILSYTGKPSDNVIKILHDLFDLSKGLMEDGTVDHYPDLTYFSEDIIIYLKEINLYQSLKTDEGRLAKVINDKSNDYWNYMIAAEGKQIITVELYDNIKEGVETVKTDPKIMELMGFFSDSMNGITSENEIDIVEIIDDGSLPFNLRGIIDNLVFVPEKKVIRINDLKKSNKPLSMVEGTIDFYKYWLQAAMYVRLVSHMFLSQSDYEGWNIEFRFIFVDSYNKPASVKISDETMAKWSAETEEILLKAKLHFDKKNFKLPYSFLINEEEELIL